MWGIIVAFQLNTVELDAHLPLRNSWEMHLTHFLINRRVRRFITIIQGG